MTVPAFAVVGHPNKGKSSIVSTLAHDDSVGIGPLPGTTLRCRRYPMSVDGKVLYVLVDTPGFQRARKVYSWLTERQTTAAGHPEVVRAFLDAHSGSPEFRNEHELLTPLMEGAGILYVVDGSVPYGSEYEAEMEILRWTGQPRMALINPIGESSYVEEWRTALGQYFGVVRVFDAVMAGFDRQLELLRAFGQLKEEWRQPLEEAVGILVAERTRRRKAAARKVADAIREMLSFKVEERISPEADPEPRKEALLERYREGLKKLESRCRDDVEKLYDHRGLRRAEDELDLLDRDQLFSKETWKVLGLSRGQVLAFGALGGGTAGGMIDLAVGGSSFFLGAVVGAGAGAAAAVLAADRLAEVKVLSLSLGAKVLTAGPTTNVNFPHIVFERGRLHHKLVSGRAHARRGDLEGSAEVRDLLPAPSGGDRRALEEAFRRIRGARDIVAATEKLAELAESLFEEDDRPSA